MPEDVTEAEADQAMRPAPAPGPAALGAACGAAVVLVATLGARLVGARVEVWWFLAMPTAVLGTAGVGLLTDGSFGLRRVLARRADRRAVAIAVGWCGLTLVGLGALGVAPATGPEGIADGWWWATIVVGIAATAGPGSVAPRPWGPAAPLARRTVVSTSVAVVLAAQLATLATRHDYHPLSRFPMFAEPRLEGATTMRARVEGVTDDGSVVDVDVPVGTATLRTWVDDDAPERLLARGSDLARRHVDRTGVPLITVRFIREEWRVAAHPGPPQLELVERIVVVEGPP